MNEKLKRFLEVKTERSPVWLDDDTIAFIRNDAAGRCIWQMDLKTRVSVQRTHGNERIWKLTAHPATGGILFCTDVGGNEHEQIYLLGRDAKEAQNLTQSPSARHYLGGMSADGRTVYYAGNRRSYATFDICKMDVESRTETIVIQNSDNYNLPADDACSPGGRYLLYNKLLGESDNALWMADLQTGTTVRIPADDRISAETNPAWRHDSSGFYLLSNRDSDFVNVWYYDVAAGTMERRYEYGWDVNSLALSGDDKYLAVLVNEGGYTRLHLYDLTTNTEVNAVRPPKGVISNYQSVCWSPSGHRLLFTLSSGKRPEGVWMLDLDAARMELLSEPAVSDDDAAALVEPVACEYESFDGLTVPYWLYVPNGKKAKNLPVVVEIHGGPEGQETPDFNDFIQYLVSEGIAVVAPNVRGSTGYGHTYTHLDDVEKRLDSVRDIDSLVAHLVESGVADQNKIAVSGTSYGGFMTLSCASRHPDLWACAVDTVGMYNLVTFLENTSEYRRPHRESEYGTLEHDRETLYNVSPAAKIQDIRAPIMIIQGRNDPRVPVTEAEQAAEALRTLGRTVEYLCYDDEGHGIGKMKNRLDCYAKVSDFLKRYLG